jgi:hypothetical protein
VQLKECNDIFVTDFSDCCSRLLNYFINFYEEDASHNEFLWFHLLDTLKIVAELPHQFYLPGRSSCSHAQEFNMKFQKTLEFTNFIVTGDQGGPNRVVHHNDMLTSNTSTRLGEFKSGLTPWEQFLRRGSPGIASDSDSSERHIPMGGLAILQRHTTRLRELAKTYTESDAFQKEQTMTAGEFMGRLDNASFHLGKDVKGSVQGHVLEPARTSIPKRLSGFSDPAMALQKPELWHLDEFVGQMKDVEPVEQPSDEFELLRVKKE